MGWLWLILIGFALCMLVAAVALGAAAMLSSMISRKEGD